MRRLLERLRLCLLGLIRTCGVIGLRCHGSFRVKFCQMSVLWLRGWNISPAEARPRVPVPFRELCVLSDKVREPSYVRRVLLMRCLV